MIINKFSDFLKKSGKKIADVAKETGLNRNSVAALYYGKVNGIRFDTLSRLYRTYGLNIADIIEVEELTQKPLAERLYRQEGAGELLNLWPAAFAFNNMLVSSFGRNFGRAYLYLKQSYFYFFINYSNANDIAAYCYRRYEDRNESEALHEKFVYAGKEMENLYWNSFSRSSLNQDPAEFEEYFRSVRNAYDRFWQSSIFIDAFDAGFDFLRMNEIAQQQGLDKSEVAVLSAPNSLTLPNERQLALLRMAEKMSGKKISVRKMRAHIAEFLQTKEALLYQRQFDFYQSNYGKIAHITLQETAKELERYVTNWKQAYRDMYRRLSNYSSAQEAQKKRILKKHGLKQNPLDFFCRLAEWREERRKINLMGFHILDGVLEVLSVKSGIPKKLLGSLSFDEVNLAWRGLIGRDTLEKRAAGGLLVIFEKGDYKLLHDVEADSLKRELDATTGEAASSEDLIYGQTACPGYAKGEAKVILDEKDFLKFKPGNIVITGGMTWPAFIPIFKKAAGIVTNEGGVTCPAGIIARELGIPCIIGTENGTERLHDGDMIEVRATHGTVKRLVSTE